MQHSKLEKIASVSFWSILLAAFLFFAFLAWSVSFKKPEQSTLPAFSVVARDEQMTDLIKPKIFLFCDCNGRKVLYPVQIVMWVQFVNLKPVPRTIVSYQFEGKSTDGIWSKLPSINPGFGWFVLSPTWSPEWRRVEFGDNVFPKIIVNKTVGAGETIGAWVFLESPTNGFDGSMRMRIKDSSDFEDVATVAHNELTNSLDMRTQDESDSKILPLDEDVSKLPRAVYSVEFQGR